MTISVSLETTAFHVRSKVSLSTQFVVAERVDSTTLLAAPFEKVTFVTAKPPTAAEVSAKSRTAGRFVGATENVAFTSGDAFVT